MKRKMTLLLVACVLLVSIGCSSQNAASSPTGSNSEPSTSSNDNSTSTPVVLKLAYEDPTSSSYHTGFKYFADELEKRSEGTIKVELYSDAQLGNAVGTIEGVKMGTIEIAHTTTAAMSNFVPEFGAVDAPFMFANADEAHKAIDGEFGKHLANLAMEKQNIRILGFTDVGFRNIFSSKPVKSVDDLSEMKIRCQEAETHMATFASLGMMPTPMPYSEIYTSISQGTIDAAENNYSSILNMKFYEVAPNIIETGHFFGFCAISMSESKFQSLSKEQQDLLLTVMDEAIEVQRQTLVDMEKSSLDKLVNEFKVDVYKLDYDQLKAATESVYKDKANILTPELMNLIGK